MSTIDFPDGDVFSLNANGDIVGPGTCIPARDQPLPGAIILNVTQLNRLYRLGVMEGNSRTTATRLVQQERISSTRALIELELRTDLDDGPPCRTCLGPCARPTEHAL